MKTPYLKPSALLATCLLTSSVYALPPEPANCPKATFIKAAGVSKTVLKVNNAWVAGRRHLAYDTANVWTLLMTNIRASNSHDAYTKATEALRSLTFQMGPISSSDKWVCVYNTLEGYPAYTVTPPLSLTQAVAYI